MAEFRAFIRDDEIMVEGPDEKIDMFTQFLDEMEEATDISLCDCKSNEKVRDVVNSYFPEYADDIMEMFEDNGGYCDCEIGVSVMTQNSIVKKLGRFMDMQDI
jgi:hypothetical protein